MTANKFIHICEQKKKKKNDDHWTFLMLSHWKNKNKKSRLNGETVMTMIIHEKSAP